MAQAQPGQGVGTSDPSSGKVVQATVIPGTFGSLRIRPFRWFWSANVGFFAAMQMQQVAQGWLVYEMTGDPLKLGGVSAATGVAMLVCSLFGGVLADRLVKRDLLLFTQASLGTIALVVGVLIATHQIQYWHLLAAALGSGAIFSFNMPARQALVAEIVGEKQLGNAVALNSSGMNLMRMGGTAIAGALLEVIGPAGVYFVMVGCYVFVITMMLMVPRIAVAPRRAKVSVLDDLREGFVYLFAAPIILTLIGAEFVLVLVGMPYQMLLPVFARDVLEVGPSGLGAMLSAVGIGALVGSLTIAALSRAPRRGAMLLGAGVLFGVALVGFAASPSFILAVVCLGFVGIGSSAYMALNNALVMGVVSPTVRGRVMSVYMFTFGLQPLGTMPLSAIASAFGAPVAVAIGGTILATAMSSIAAFRPAIRRLT